MTAEIFAKIREYNGAFDKIKVKRVFDFAVEQYRDTEGSMNYVMEVLEVLLPLKPDEDTILAVLLHDLYLSGFLNDDKLREIFGGSVVDILNSFKKLSYLNYAENDKSSQVEVLRKMFLTMARDIRVILIWLASRLCKMQNLDLFPEAGSKVRISRETMDVFVPIASRLGVYRIKTQLEDLAFQYLNPQEFKSISKQVEEYGKSRKVAIEAIREKLADFLDSHEIDAYVFGRFKSIYSIYRKTKAKRFTDVSDLYDLFAIRVILPAKTQLDHLYSVLGLIHSEWKPISSRFKDYIAVPKPNGYRSLHTVVLGLAPDDMQQPVEIQIRDDRMHREAEYGVASHWLYKDYGVADNALSSQAQWIRGLEKIHEVFDAGSEVMKEIELDIFQDRIFVLTPRGEVKDLPVGSIPLDFAYAIHTDVGNRCVMAKVNHVLVSLDYELKNGDVVEIITRKDAAPKLRWLSIVRSSFAKHKIKAYFSSLNRDNNIKEGRRLLNAQLERLNKPMLDQNYSVLKDYAGQSLNLVKRENLVEEVGKGAKLASDIIRKIYPYEKNLETRDIVSKAEPQLFGNNQEKSLLEEQVLVGGEAGLPIKIAACCQPKMKDDIIGYVTRGSRITIHKKHCRLIATLDKTRMIGAQWKGRDSSSGGLKVGVKCICVSRVGLIHDITSIINNFGINILDVVIKKAGGGLYEDCFLLDLEDFDQFDQLFDKLEGIKGVIKVTRDDAFKG